jgi:hypothetical protein
MSPYVRIAKIASGARAVQIVYYLDTPGSGTSMFEV